MPKLAVEPRHARNSPHKLALGDPVREVHALPRARVGGSRKACGVLSRDSGNSVKVGPFLVVINISLIQNLGDERNPKRVHGSETLNRNYSRKR